MIGRAIFKRKIFDQMQALAIPVALHGDGKAALGLAENSLVLANASDFAVKELLDMQNAVTDQRIVQRWFSSAGGGQGKKADSKVNGAHWVSFAPATLAGSGKFAATRKCAWDPPEK